MRFHTSQVRMLLKMGCNPNVRDRSQGTVLHYCAQVRSPLPTTDEPIHVAPCAITSPSLAGWGRVRAAVH